MHPIKIKVVQYSFDTAADGGRQAIKYDQLVYKLRKRGLKCFNVIAGTYSEARAFSEKLESLNGEVELDPTSVWDNQFTASGLRVFDWYEGIVPNKWIKCGHYIEPSPELDELRRNTLVCGYCGHKTSAARGLTVCDQCLGSEYLQPTELDLLKLLPICDSRKKRKLTPRERTDLLPAYQASQSATQARKWGRKCETAKEELAQAQQAMAATEYFRKCPGLDPKWLLAYRGKAIFGMPSEPLTWEQVKIVLGAVTEFDGLYEIRGLDETGKIRTWENY